MADTAEHAGGRLAPEHILVTDDDRAFRLATQTLLEDEGYRVSLAGNASEALAMLRSGEHDLLLSDLVMEAGSGIELLRQVKSWWPDLPVIMVTGFGSIQTAVDAMRLGASDYLTKPCNNLELLLKIRKALDAQRRERELKHLREQVEGSYSFGNIVSRSERMRDVLRQIQQVADTDVTVLVRGESGTGKELVARALHFNGLRRGGPFVAVNCSALPENLLESELFGYERGAFTGALKSRAGRFEEAEGGTLFLDEIGDISLAVQTKLLRVLQEKSFQRVGGNKTIAVDVRIVAATNRNLETMMAHGDFREDLYYRLSVFPVTLPPLRERLEDLPLLTAHFLEQYGQLAGGDVQHVSHQAMHEMMNYSWRGNIRELENLLKRAIIKAKGDTIFSIELPGEPAAMPPSDDSRTDLSPAMPYKDYVGAALRDAEERYLLRALRACKGNVNQVAKLMDVDRKTVYRKLAEYRIELARFRE